MPFGIGFPELVIVAIVAIILFGGRLPEVARSLGQSYQQFRKGLHEIQSTIRIDLDAEPTRKQSQTYRDYDLDADPPPNTKFIPPEE